MKRQDDAERRNLKKENFRHQPLKPSKEKKTEYFSHNLHWQDIFWHGLCNRDCDKETARALPAPSFAVPLQRKREQQSKPECPACSFCQNLFFPSSLFFSPPYLPEVPDTQDVRKQLCPNFFHYMLFNERKYTTVSQTPGENYAE